MRVSRRAFTVKRICASLAIVWLLSATAPLAQTPYGSIRGHLYDEQKAVLSGATISATAPEAPGTFTTTSDSEGFYRLIDLPPGSYSVNAELPSFAKFIREPVIVRAGLNVLLDIDMKVGAISEALEVK